MKMMTRHAALAAVLAAGLALSLAACGSEPAATSAAITFRSDPPAEVWIAGTSKGTTPLVLTMAPGSHPVEFRADGFTTVAQAIEVAGGKPLTIEALLTASSDDDVVLASLGRVLGVEHAPFEEPAFHRGGSDAAVMLYWPQRDVRQSGVTSFRIDVTEDYAGDGFIEFRQGSKVLHREPFNPSSYETVKAIPGTVREVLKTGRTIEWGVYFDGNRSSDVKTTFKVVDDRKIERKLAKLESSKFFQRQAPLMQEMLRLDVLRNNRLYSETLVQSLGILNANPGLTAPYKPIVESLQRLRLRDTPLYTFAAPYVGGHGGIGRSELGGGIGMGGAPGATAPGVLPPVLAAPKGFEAGRFAAAPKQGGVYVRPTEEATKAPITEGQGGATDGSDPGAPVDPRGGVGIARGNPYEKRVEGLQALIGSKELLLREAQEAKDDLDEAIQRADDAHQDFQAKMEAKEAADTALREATEAGAPQAEIDAAEAAVRAADEAVAEARRAQDDAERQRDETARSVEQILQATGTPERLQADIEKLKADLELAERDAEQAARREAKRAAANPAVSGAPGVPVDPNAAKAAGRNFELRQKMDKAFADLGVAQSLQRDAVDRHTQTVDALGVAQAEFEAAQASGDPVLIAEATAALNAAMDANAEAQAAMEAAAAELERALKVVEDLAPPRPR